MCTIRYKYGTRVSYKTLNFDALHVAVDELKRTIYENEALNPESFDLLIINVHSKRKYTGNDVIPNNSSLTIKRVPHESEPKAAEKLYVFYSILL